MNQVQLSDVQLTNLTLLMTIRNSLQLDRIGTCEPPRDSRRPVGVSQADVADSAS